MRQRWLSRQALLLHLAVVVWVPGCMIAFWWQVHRAFAGNGLSYLYSVEWPAFAVTGIWAWWQLLHTDPATVGRRAQERLAVARAAADDDPGTAAAAAAGAPLAAAASEPTAPGGPAAPAAGTSGAAATVPLPGPHPARRREEEDEELAAYNDRLARLAADGPKTWKRR